MAPRRIYTRSNPNLDPNLPEVVEDPERILKNKKTKIDSGNPSINRSISFPEEGFISVDDLEFDLKFEHSLFRSESDSDLSQIVFDQGRFNTFIPSTYSIFSKEEKQSFVILSPLG